MSRFHETILRDSRRFFEEVYEKVRDSFLEKVVKEISVEEQSKISEASRQTQMLSSEKTRGERKTLMNWLLSSGKKQDEDETQD